MDARFIVLSFIVNSISYYRATKYYLNILFQLCTYLSKIVIVCIISFYIDY